MSMRARFSDDGLEPAPPSGECCGVPGCSGLGNPPRTVPPLVVPPQRDGSADYLPAPYEPKHRAGVTP